MTSKGGVVSHGALWAIVVAVVPTLWFTFIEPRVVWSEEFTPVKQAVFDMRIDQLEMRIEYHQDRIRSLEIQEVGAGLNDEEYSRLFRYRDKVGKLMRELARVGG